jgi:WD40 repeat protein
MRPHSKAVHAVAISQDGQMLASAGNDGFVVLTDTRSLVQLGRFRIPEFDANGSAYLDFSSDRRRLIVSNYFINTRGTGVTSGTRVWVYDVGFESWSEKACAIANRELTEREKHLYMQGIEADTTGCGGRERKQSE